MEKAISSVNTIIMCIIFSGLINNLSSVNKIFRDQVTINFENFRMSNSDIISKTAR